MSRLHSRSVANQTKNVFPEVNEEFNDDQLRSLRDRLLDVLMKGVSYLLRLSRCQTNILNLRDPSGSTNAGNHAGFGNAVGEVQSEEFRNFFDMLVILFAVMWQDPLVPCLAPMSLKFQVLLNNARRVMDSTDAIGSHFISRFFARILGLLTDISYNAGLPSETFMEDGHADGQAVHTLDEPGSIYRQWRILNILLVRLAHQAVSSCVPENSDRFADAWSHEIRAEF
ncbi:hypothetical protein OBBRIDRAFT_549694 [Obba rivulosa]|uniref:Uncharacterized protein n=1 Tax=Obba rivulosa TaxID=1052685 RepID=A0A8E2DMK3_9APHY|nr:hypothetical protein OBBRIDRAFT_549694 [Obba rivulosa]